MNKLQLPINLYGNVNVQKGLPDSVCFLPTDAPLEELALAGIPTAKAVIGFESGYFGSKPCFAAQLVAPKGWERELEAWRESDVGKVALMAHAESVARVSEEKTAKRREAARRAQQTRAENKKLQSNHYGHALFWLREAQRASDRAKSRAANGCRRSDYWDRDNSFYSAANYRRSRNARERDYAQKEEAIGEAVQIAPLAGISFGWGAPDDSMAVVYFDLPSGQVSFHCTARFGGPDYAGTWDGVRGVSAERIEAAIRKFLSDGGVKTAPLM